MSVRVKICGITCLEDALLAVEAGADALGFVFYPPSPRAVTPAQALPILQALPPFVVTVGLFVDTLAPAIRQLVAATGLSMVQCHGTASATAAELAPLVCLPALSVRDRASLAVMARQPAAAWLLDAYVPGAHGGTGQTCDWELAAEVARHHRIVLAGGLTPDNVAAAIRQVRPYAVDVSSGVESVPGRKDPAKLIRFIRNAKGAENP